MIRIPLKVKANLLTQEELVTIASGSSNSIKVKFDIDPNSDFADSTLQKRAIFRYYQGSYFISDVDANGEVYVPKFVIAYPYFKVALRAESENATIVVTTNEIQVPVEKSPVFYETTITDGDVTIRNLDGALNIYKAGDVTFIDFTASYKTAVDAVIAGTYATTSALSLVASDVDSIKEDVIDMSNSISDLQGDIADLGTTKADKDNVYTKGDIEERLAEKQDTLVSGDNIKTLNGTSLLGSGNYDFDTALNENSTNAVQNKVIAKFANDVAGTYVTKIELYEALKRGEVSSEVEKVYTNEINYIAENVMPSGKVTKILGKTKKSENLLVLPNESASVRAGVTRSILNGVIYYSGTPNTQYAPVYRYTSFTLSAGTYYFKDFGSTNIENYSKFCRLRIYDENSNVTEIRSENAFTITGNETLFELLFQVDNYQDTQISGTCRPMIVAGSTAPTTWSQGYNGLRRTHITGLKTTGINQWDEKTKLGYYQSSNGAFVNSNNQLCSENPIRIIPNATYYIKKNSITDLRFYDCKMNYISGNQQGSNSSFTTPNNACYLHINLRSDYGTTYNHNICINISDATINGNYYPYEEKTVNIEADLNGVGTASDEINVEDGKKYQRMNILADLGAENWIRQQAYGKYEYFCTAIQSLVSRSTQNIVCEDYVVSIRSGLVNYGIAIGSEGNIFIRDDSCQDVASLKAKLAGKPLVYELATPIVTDVEVENGGWLSNLIKGGSITQLVDTDNLIAKEVDIAMNVVVDNQ